MAAFSDLTPILLDTSCIQPMPGGSWVLWPVHGYRVVAPCPVEVSLNTFQRAILGLCHAGMRTIEAQADLLAIETDLASVVFDELHQQGMISPTGVLTRRGQNALGDLDEERLADPTVGWLFADAFSGTWWPRFFTGPLPTYERGPNERDGTPLPGPPRVQLRWGTEGNPHTRSALCWLPPDLPPAPLAPTPDQILALIRRRRRRGLLADEQPRLRQIALVDDSPSSFLLALRVTIDPDGIQVDDPLRGDPSPELAVWLEGTSHDEARPLWNWLQGGPQKARLAHVQELHEQAEREVERLLTVAILDHTDEMALLVAMQRALLEAQQPDPPRDKWDDVLLKTQKVLERLVSRTLPTDRQLRHQLREILPLRDHRAAQALFDGLIEQLGYSLPSRLTAIKPGKVQAALESRSGSLRPLLLAALLSVRLDPSHPLRHAAHQAPDLLRKFDLIAGLRDGAAHAGRPNTISCQKEIEDGVSFAFEATRALLLPLPPRVP